MNLELRLRRNACITAVLGMLALGLAEMNPVWLLLIAGVSAAAWVLERRDSAWRIGPAGLNAILLAAVGFAVLDYFYISGGWIVSLAHFLLIVQMAKLLLPKGDRDVGQMYLISLMNVSVAAVVATDVLFAVALAFYSAAVIRGMILYHFRHELAGAAHVYLPGGEETARPTAQPDMRRVVSRRFLATVTAVVVTAWVFNGLFFLFVPRLPVRLFRLAPGGWLQRLTGYSDSVRLGDIGRIMENGASVMHVELFDAKGTPLRGERNLYFRGLTYQHYDGLEWQRHGPELSGVSTLLPDPTLPNPVPLREDFSRPDLIYQEIRLEPIRTASIFTLQGALIVAGQDTSRSLIHSNQLDWTFTAVPPPSAPYKYRVWSVVDPSDRLFPPALLLRSRGAARPIALPRVQHDAYLQLPYKLSDRVRALAESVARTREAPSAAERARRIEEYLRRACSYTLDLKPNPDAEPVDDFLFTTKTGHCEYFASSMVVLLRCAGVPARLVTGFHGGEWNDVGEWYLVKQSDAHAWAEAWVDGEGWTRYDPTPAVERDREAARQAMGRFGRWLDYFRTNWMNYVVQYDHEQQSAVFRTTRNASRQVREATSRVLSAVGGFFRSSWQILTDLKRLTTTEGALILAGTLATSTVLVLTARWAVKQAARRLRAAYDRRVARRVGRVHVGFYQELLRLLKRRGFVREEAETPLEFADALAGAFGPADASVREITDAYYRVRFGGAPLSPDDEKRLRTLLDQLRTAPVCRD